MKTLKKTLCLVLAVVMVLGVMAISTSAAGLTFSDADDIQYKEAVEVLVGLGIIDGMGDGTFDADGTLTRAQAAKIIAYMLGKQDRTGLATFTDVPDSHWARNYIAFCAGEGIVGGYGDGNFGPEDPVTREELASIVYNYALHKKADIFLKANYKMNYTDKSSISAWAYIPMTWCSMKGIIVGKEDGSVLDPKGTATRAEAASIIRRLGITLGK